MTDPVVLAPYDPAWPAAFERLAARAAAVLRPLGPVIEHVGSTAVPGLAAKPVIDLDVLLPVAAHADATALLATLGYEAQGEKGVPGRFAFRWPAGEPRHHLYLGAPDAPGIRAHLVLRDALRADAGLRAAYAAAKQEALANCGGDRERYQQLKGAFIEQALVTLGATGDPAVLLGTTAEFVAVSADDLADHRLSADEALAQLAAFDTVPLTETGVPIDPRAAATPPEAGREPETVTGTMAGDLLAFSVDEMTLSAPAVPPAPDAAALERQLSALDDFELLDS